MILIDTPVWINHWRSGVPQLLDLLDGEQVLMHPMVVGELACGNLRDRIQVLESLSDLPEVTVAFAEEVLVFIERHQLMGRGIGYVDVNLLASTALHRSARLWTVDGRLRDAAVELGLAYSPAAME